MSYPVHDIKLAAVIFALKLWRHWRWLEVIKDYDMEIVYHLGKANRVADALSRRPKVTVNAMMTVPWELYRELYNFGLEIFTRYKVGHSLGAMTVQPTLFDRMIEAQLKDPKVVELIHKVKANETDAFELGERGELRMNGRLCVPNQPKLKNKILKEGHQSLFHLHPDRDKMIEEIRELVWWKGLRKNVSEFLSKCLVCQRVKFERQKSSGLLQPLPVADWKWDSISIDFLIGPPRTQQGNNVIWVIVDR